MSDEEKVGAIVRDELNRTNGFDPTWENVHNAALAGLRAGREQQDQRWQRAVGCSLETAEMNAAAIRGGGG